MKSQLEIDVECMVSKIEECVLDQVFLREKIVDLQQNVLHMHESIQIMDKSVEQIDSLKENVIAIQKALELMAKSVSLAKEELQEKHANSNTEVPK